MTTITTPTKNILRSFRYYDAAIDGDKQCAERIIEALGGNSDFFFTPSIVLPARNYRNGLHVPSNTYFQVLETGRLAGEVRTGFRVEVTPEDSLTPSGGSRLVAELQEMIPNLNMKSTVMY